MAIPCVVGGVVGGSVLVLLEAGSVWVVASVLTILESEDGVVSEFVVGSEGWATVDVGTAVGSVGVEACVVVAGGTVERLGFSS